MERKSYLFTIGSQKDQWEETYSFLTFDKNHIVNIGKGLAAANGWDLSVHDLYCHYSETDDPIFNSPRIPEGWEDAGTFAIRKVVER